MKKGQVNTTLLIFDTNWIELLYKINIILYQEVCSSVVKFIKLPILLFNAFIILIPALFLHIALCTQE